MRTTRPSVASCPTCASSGCTARRCGESVRLRITAHALRTVEHRGGLDGFLLAASDRELSSDLRRLKRRIEAARADGQSAPAEAD